MSFDPGGYLSLDGLGEKSLRSVVQHIGQHILRRCGWHRRRFGGTLHEAYSFCPRGQFGVCYNTKGTPLFYPVTIHNFGLYLAEMPPKALEAVVSEYRDALGRDPKDSEINGLLAYNRN